VLGDRTSLGPLNGGDRTINPIMRGDPL